MRRVQYTRVLQSSCSHKEVHSHTVQAKGPNTLRRRSLRPHAPQSPALAKCKRARSGCALTDAARSHRLRARSLPRHESDSDRLDMQNAKDNWKKKKALNRTVSKATTATAAETVASTATSTRRKENRRWPRRRTWRRSLLEDY
jgi:hypothetical protein